LRTCITSLQLRNPVNNMEMLRLYLDTFGRRGFVVAFLSRISKYLNRPVVMLVPTNQFNRRCSVLIRLRTSDISIFKEVFVDNRLDFNLPKSPSIVIDAGAYTGLSSVYFAIRYPDARVIAIEPEKSNFDILLRNIKPFTNIFPIQAALWKEQVELSLYDPGRGECGYQTLDAEARGDRIQRVLGVTVDKVMLDYNIEFIDILKLDIEGAEKEVFEFSRNWVHKVGVLVVELHDRLRKGCTDAFETAARDFEYEEKRQGRTIRMKKEFALSNISYKQVLRTRSSTE